MNLLSAASNGPIFILQIIYESGDHGGMILTGKIEGLGDILSQYHFVHNKSHVD
jgi:hypothetical protein